MDFKKDAKIETDDFWYDIFEGGYIRPEDYLDNKVEIIIINSAIELLKNFKTEAEIKGIIGYQ